MVPVHFMKYRQQTKPEKPEVPWIYISQIATAYLQAYLCTHGINDPTAVVEYSQPLHYVAQKRNLSPEQQTQELQTKESAYHVLPPNVVVEINRQVSGLPPYDTELIKVLFPDGIPSKFTRRKTN